MIRLFLTEYKTKFWRKKNDIKVKHIQTIYYLMRSVLLISLAIFLLNSCSTIYYKPNNLQMPLFSSKGEIKGKVSFGNYNVEPQLAFAVTNHIALMANGGFSLADSTGKSPKRTFFEGAIGYYSTVEAKEGAIFETYAGFGRGNLYGNYNFLKDNVNAWYNRIFVQPNIGIRSKNFEISVGVRFAAINVHKTYPTMETSGRLYYLEPATSLRIGIQRVKLDLQVGFSGNLSKTMEDLFPHNPIIVSLGCQFTIGGKIFKEY